MLDQIKLIPKFSNFQIFKSSNPPTFAKASGGEANLQIIKSPNHQINKSSLGLGCKDNYNLKLP